MKTFPDAFAFAASAGVSALLGKRVLNCVWELTYRCNARCSICTYWKHPTSRSSELTSGEVMTGLDKVHANGCRVVNFTGGEPTLRDDLETLVAHASRLGMWTSIVTNGLTMTRRRMTGLRRAGLDNLFISLDSNIPEEHDAQRGVSGSFDRVMSCLEDMKRVFLRGHRTGGIMCVLSKTNTPHVEDVIRLADSKGVFLVFQPYHPNKTGEDGLCASFDEELTRRILEMKTSGSNVISSDTYLRHLSRFGKTGFGDCNAGTKYFSVDPSGGLHSCVDLPAVGDVRFDDLSVVRTPAALARVRRCRGCWYCFRGEADCMLSPRGCIEKIGIGLRVMRTNTRARRARPPV